MKKRKVFQRLFSALLALTMAVTMMPGSTYAAEISGNEVREPEKAAISGNEASEPEKKEISGNEASEPEKAAISGNEASEPEEAAVSSNGTGKESSPEGVTLSEAKDSVLEGQITNLPEEAWETLNLEGKPAYDSVISSPEGPRAIQNQTVMLVGGLPYVTGFTGYDEERKNQEGHYAALRIPVSDEAQLLAAASKGVVFTVKGDQEKSFSYSEELIQGAKGNYHIDLIWRLNPESEGFTITPDWDGEGTDYKATDYTIDTRGIVFEAKPRGRIAAATWGNNIYGGSDQTVPIKNGMGIRYATWIPYTYLKKEDIQLLNFADKAGAPITEGHFAAVKITAPVSISITNGKDTQVVIAGHDEMPAYTDMRYIGNRYIYQIFYVTKDSLGTARTITVDWNGEYEEIYTVEFASNLLLEKDLDATAAPKSLALVSPEKTMYVDQTQQLSVKVTRNQAEDRVWLGYESDKEDVAEVDSDGLITARKEGKACITVYPLDKRGQALKDSKGKYVKSAKVTITVKKVTAPAKLKVIGAGDRFARIGWKENTTGSRTELYVLPGKGKKAADFEAAIGAAVEPLLPVAVAEGWVVNVHGLNANTDYTVYARTVSAGRNSVAGSVISFKTTKVLPVNIQFVAEEGNPIEKKDFTFDKDHKTLTVKAEFVYPENASPEECLTNIKPVYEIESNTRSTIDKNGKITFKDAEDVTVVAYYEIPEIKLWIANGLRIDVTAEAAKISSRTTKLSVGQKAEIGSLVAYDVEGVEKSFTKETLEAFRKAADKEGKPLFYVEYDFAAEGGYTIQALRPCNAKIEMKEEAIEKGATAVIKVSQLAAPGAIQLEEDGSGCDFTCEAVLEADYHLIEILDGKKAVLDTWKDDSGKAYIRGWFRLLPNEQRYVRVTAFFGDDQASKPVISKAVKYIGPAIDNLSLYRAYEYRQENIKGKMSVGVGEVGVLAAEVNLYIQAAESDSLIWESSNPKVAAVKANKSSFGAQLIGIKSGTATITIKSRKTKDIVKSFEVEVFNS